MGGGGVHRHEPLRLQCFPPVPKAHLCRVSVKVDHSVSSGLLAYHSPKAYSSFQSFIIPGIPLSNFFYGCQPQFIGMIFWHARTNMSASIKDGASRCLSHCSRIIGCHNPAFSHNLLQVLLQRKSSRPWTIVTLSFAFHIEPEMDHSP